MWRDDFRRFAGATSGSPPVWKDTIMEFTTDVRHVLLNAAGYNPPLTSPWLAARKLSAVFERLLLDWILDPGVRADNTTYIYTYIHIVFLSFSPLHLVFFVLFVFFPNFCSFSLFLPLLLSSPSHFHFLSPSLSMFSLSPLAESTKAPTVDDLDDDRCAVCRLVPQADQVRIICDR